MHKISKDNKIRLEKEIQAVLKRMETLDPSTEDYKELSGRLTTLTDIRDKSNRDKVSADTMAIVVTNLLGIYMIIRHEELNVISTKASNFVLRGRV